MTEVVGPWASVSRATALVWSGGTPATSTTSSTPAKSHAKNATALVRAALGSAMDALSAGANALSLRRSLAEHYCPDAA